MQIKFFHCFPFIAEKCDGEAVDENNEKPNTEANLYLYDDELDTRPHISTFISSLANYENTIPAATDPDAKAPAPSARMGESHNSWEEYIKGL